MICIITKTSDNRQKPCNKAFKTKVTLKSKPFIEKSFWAIEIWSMEDMFELLDHGNILIKPSNYRNCKYKTLLEIEIIN